MAPVNRAAVIPEARAHPMRVETVEYPTPGEGEIVIKVGAIAINPIDWMIQTLGENLFAWLQYPLVNGFDVAGTVEEVGPGVAAGFAKGDRVLGLGAGFVSREGAYQEYVAVKANMASKIPDSLSLADASVLPLGVATAAGALYEPGALELALPSVEAAPGSQGKVVIVWAGSSSVGSNAVQLAAGSGYEVFTTSSPHNFDFCKSLGASRVFDYKSPTVAADIIAALKGKTVAGAVAIYQPSLDIIYEVLSSADVVGDKRVGAAMPLGDAAPPAGITAKGVFGGTIKDNHIGAAVYNDFLPKALAKGSYKTKPEALVVGNGLEAIQAAVDKCKENTASAQKLVVTLE